MNEEARKCLLSALERYETARGISENKKKKTNDKSTKQQNSHSDRIPQASNPNPQ